jgi:hypothetical protein
VCNINITNFSIFFTKVFPVFASVSTPCNIKCWFFTRHNTTELFLVVIFFVCFSFYATLMLCSSFYFIFISGQSKKSQSELFYSLHFLPCFIFLFLRKLNRVKLKNSTRRTREQQQSGLNILNELKCGNQSGTRSNHISNKHKKRQQRTSGFGFTSAHVNVFEYNAYYQILNSGKNIFQPTDR